MDESLIGIIIAAGCGLLCAGLGAYMVVTGNPSLLHAIIMRPPRSRTARRLRANRAPDSS